MRRLPSETIARLLEEPPARLRQQVHMGLYGGIGDAKGFTLGDLLLLRLAHRLRDPGLPLGTAWVLAGGFAEPLALEMAEAEPHSAVFALVPHGGTQAPCTVSAEDLREAMLDLLQGASTVTVINLSEVAEEVSVEWALATGQGAELERKAEGLSETGRKRMVSLIEAARTKLASGAVRVAADGAIERVPA